MDFFVGSYTSLGGPGIARLRLESNRLLPICALPLPEATYAIFNQDEKTLYALSSGENMQNPTIHVLRITKDGMTDICTQSVPDVNPCHLCLDEKERFLYTACYTSGSVCVFPILANGMLGSCCQSIQHSGSSVHPARQSSAHVHHVSFLGDLLCAVDLGLDKLMLYRQDKATGLLSFVSSCVLPGGTGPRHLLAGENDLFYLSCELSNQVATLKKEGDKLHLLSLSSTLPEGYTGESTASAIRKTADGQLIVSNRGYDSFAFFSLQNPEKPTLIKILKSSGAYPRDFDLLPDGSFVTTCQYGNVCHEVPMDDSMHLLASCDLHGCVCVVLPKGEK